jgi:metallo-beta-lactamase class B
VVYADSLTPVAAPGFRFTGGGGHPSIEEAFRRSITTVAALPCDILLSTHPSATAMGEKLRLRALQPKADPFIDPQACRSYAAAALEQLEKRVAEESRISALSGSLEQGLGAGSTTAAAAESGPSWRRP